MKKGIFLLTITSFCISACSDDSCMPPTGIVDNWQLTEVFMDPGDGSGTFQPTDQVLVIAFNADGTINATDGVCSLLGSGSESDALGTYNQELSEIYISNCGDFSGEETLKYELEGNTLIVNRLCRERCAQRFERIMED